MWDPSCFRALGGERRKSAFGISPAGLVGMKSSIIVRNLAIGCIASVAALSPVYAQSSSGSASSASTGTASEPGNQENSPGTSQTIRPAENSALNNHGQGANNNQTRTGGSNGERRVGKTEDAHSDSDNR